MIKVPSVPSPFWQRQVELAQSGLEAPLRREAALRQRRMVHSTNSYNGTFVPCFDATPLVRRGSGAVGGVLTDPKYMANIFKSLASNYDAINTQIPPAQQRVFRTPADDGKDHVLELYNQFKDGYLNRNAEQSVISLKEFWDAFQKWLPYFNQSDYNVLDGIQSSLDDVVNATREQQQEFLTLDENNKTNLQMKYITATARKIQQAISNYEPLLALSLPERFTRFRGIARSLGLEHLKKKPTPQEVQEDRTQMGDSQQTESSATSRSLFPVTPAFTPRSPGEFGSPSTTTTEPGMNVFVSPSSTVAEPGEPFPVARGQELPSTTKEINKYLRETGDTHVGVGELIELWRQRGLQYKPAGKTALHVVIKTLVRKIKELQK